MLYNLGSERTTTFGFAFRFGGWGDTPNFNHNGSLGKLYSADGVVFQVDTRGQSPDPTQALGTRRGETTPEEGGLKNDPEVRWKPAPSRSAVCRPRGEDILTSGTMDLIPTFPMDTIRGLATICTGRTSGPTASCDETETRFAAPRGRNTHNARDPRTAIPQGACKCRRCTGAACPKSDDPLPIGIHRGTRAHGLLLALPRRPCHQTQGISWQHPQPTDGTLGRKNATNTMANSCGHRHEHNRLPEAPEDY